MQLITVNSSILKNPSHVVCYKGIYSSALRPIWPCVSTIKDIASSLRHILFTSETLVFYHSIQKEYKLRKPTPNWKKKLKRGICISLYKREMQVGIFFLYLEHFVANDLNVKASVKKNVLWIRIFKNFYRV